MSKLGCFSEISFGPRLDGKRLGLRIRSAPSDDQKAEHPQKACLCGACAPERGDAWRRHSGLTCPWCGGEVRSVLDGEVWCDACERYL